MAAPPEMNLREIDGVWNMNRTLSTSLEPTFALQGMNVFIRKIVSSSSVTVSITTTIDPITKVPHMNIEQNNGLKTITERRVLDWSLRESQSPLLGALKGQSRWIELDTLKNGGGEKVGEEGEEEEEVDVWLTEGWEDGMGEVLHAVVRDAKGTWSTSQVWGFEVVGGERRYVRRMVTRRGDSVERAKLVYDWVGKQ